MGWCRSQRNDHANQRPAFQYFRMDDTELKQRIDAWIASRTPAELGDPIWSLAAYRTARYALHCATGDAERLQSQSPETADQLIRAAGSVSSNIGEGYGRRTHSEQSQFYSYALGSVREVITWYGTVERRLPDGVAMERVEIWSRARRMLFGLLRMCRERRSKAIRGT